jgi:flavin reductase (DIM6/NTAB) family NADH-FMN oxidoreductase RutF
MLNPGPVAIVTTAWRGETNAAPIAWCAPLSMEPPIVGIVVHPHRHTADMIRFSDGFAINIPGPKLLKQTAFLGTQSGVNTKKLEASGLETFSPLFIDAPLIEGCLAWIECTLHDVIPIGDHTLFAGSVVKVQADDEAYAQQWLLKDREHSPLTFIGGARYAVVGPRKRRSSRGRRVFGTSGGRRKRTTGAFSRGDAPPPRIGATTT